MSTIAVSSILLALSSWASAQASGLAACPRGDRTIGPMNNQFLSICPGTDYWSPNVNTLGNVASVDDCAARCADYPGCSKASYNAGSKTCYLKGSPTNEVWFETPDLATIRVVNLSKCPVAERIVGDFNGKTMTTCPASDYYSPNISVLDNIASVDDCAARCGNTDGCAIASYNAAQRVCYLKGDPKSYFWFSTPDLATVRSAKLPEVDPVPSSAAPAASSSLSPSPSRLSTASAVPSPSPPVIDTSSCPRGGRGVVVENNTAVICTGTDYWSPNIESRGNFVTAEDCAKWCARYTDCLIASYNRVGKTCYLKGNPANPDRIDSPDLDSIKLAKPGVTITSPSPPMGPLPQYPGVGNNPGRWGAVFPLPVIPVAGYIVPEWPEATRMMIWSAWAKDKFSLWSPPNGYTSFADYNFKTGQTSARTVSNTGHDMFCPGVSSLVDGRVVVSGGTNAEVVSIYDPKTNAFTRAADMKIGRGYQTSVTLSNGRVFTIGGAFTGVRTGKVGEVYDPVANTWTLLPGARSEPILTSYDWEGDWRYDNHAWLFPWSGGSVFHAGPSMQMNWIGTQGQGSIQPAGVRDAEADAMCGIHVMYDAVAGKIFSTGGSQSYTASAATARAHITTITTAFVNATVERLPNALDPRGFANIVVLPNGQLILTGGQRVSRVFQDDDSIFAAELFDPPSKTFRRLAAAKTPRNYHAISLLLADGRVFTGGGGMCGNLAPGEDDRGCNRAVDHMDGEIFSPPYLFNNDMTLATRPVISSVTAPLENNRAVKAGGTITVRMNTATQHTLALVRMGSATHSVNSDQRRVPLTRVSRSGAVHTVTLPSDYGVLTPGYYYLFAMNDRGVPSVARTLQVVL